MVGVTEMDNWIVADGNPFDGMNVTGPFDSFESAEEWVNDSADIANGTYFILQLDEP